MQKQAGEGFRVALETGLLGMTRSEESLTLSVASQKSINRAETGPESAPGHRSPFAFIVRADSFYRASSVNALFH